MFGACFFAAAFFPQQASLGSVSGVCMYLARTIANLNFMWTISAIFYSFLRPLFNVCKNPNLIVFSAMACGVCMAGRDRRGVRREDGLRAEARAVRHGLHRREQGGEGVRVSALHSLKYRR